MSYDVKTVLTKLSEKACEVVDKATTSAKAEMFDVLMGTFNTLLGEAATEKSAKAESPKTEKPKAKSSKAKASKTTKAKAKKEASKKESKAKAKAEVKQEVKQENTISVTANEKLKANVNTYLTEHLKSDKTKIDSYYKWLETESKKTYKFNRNGKKYNLSKEAIAETQVKLECVKAFIDNGYKVAAPKVMAEAKNKQVKSCTINTIDTNEMKKFKKAVAFVDALESAGVDIECVKSALASR